MAEVRYEVAPAVRMVLLDDEAVVYNPFTRETHVLNPAATLVLDEIRRQPCGHGDLTALLAEVLEEGERTAASGHAARLLDELASLRLIGPANARR